MSFGEVCIDTSAYKLHSLVDADMTWKVGVWVILHFGH